MTLCRLTAAICALVLTSAGAVCADTKPVPPPSGSTLPKSGVEVAGIPKKPDLVVTFEGAGPGLPKGFTVKNVGTADSKLSVLKVTVAWVPPEATSWAPGGCGPFISKAECDELLAVSSCFSGGSPGTSTGISLEKMKKMCGMGFPEALEAVPVLKPGESKTFARDTGPYQVSLSGALQKPGSPQASHIKPCSPTIVCAWDVKAVADASHDNDERDESNNTATRRALREIIFK